MELTSEQQSFSAKVGELVNEAAVFARRFGDSSSADPAKGSQADDEIYHHSEVGTTHPWGPKPVEDAYNVAAVLYAGAGQYLRSLRQLFNDDMVLFGFQAVTRALLEAAARSWWVLDPEKTVRERVERAYEERWYSFLEMQKVANAAGGAFKQQVAKDNVLRLQAAELGLPERTDRGSPFCRFRGFGTPRPDSTKLVPDLLKTLGMPRFAGAGHRMAACSSGRGDPRRCDRPALARQLACSSGRCKHGLRHGRALRTGEGHLQLRAPLHRGHLAPARRRARIDRRPPGHRHRDR